MQQITWQPLKNKKLHFQKYIIKPFNLKIRRKKISTMWFFFIKMMQHILCIFVLYFPVKHLIYIISIHNSSSTRKRICKYKEGNSPSVTSMFFLAYTIVQTYLIGSQQRQYCQVRSRKSKEPDNRDQQTNLLCPREKVRVDISCTV